MSEYVQDSKCPFCGAKIDETNILNLFKQCSCGAYYAVGPIEDEYLFQIDVAETEPSCEIEDIEVITDRNYDYLHDKEDPERGDHVSLFFGRKKK